MDGIAELSKSLQQMDIDASAYACLSALTLVSGKCGAELILSPHPVSGKCSAYACLSALTLSAVSALHTPAS